MSRRLLLVAAAALVNEKGEVLIAQRPADKPMPGLWEFPGGKLEPGETPETALVRELREELAIMVAQDDLVPLTFASHGYDDFHLLMPLYLCRRWQGEIVERDVEAVRFVPPERLDSYPMPPADAPLVRVIQAGLPAP